MNLGGFSWRRFLGISAAKSRISRKIGIPLTASGRRRKLGASIFKAIGPVAGTVAVGAVGAVEAVKAAKQEHKSTGSETIPTPPATSEPRKPRGIYFCEVKGVTHTNDDGTNRADAMKLCSVGDPVKLVPDPQNPHDHNAIRVFLESGQQIGYLSARQASRFADKVHRLTATVHSRVKDEWGNDTLRLRVVNSAEQAHSEYAPSTNPQSPHADAISALQREVQETEKQEGWQRALVYFEDAQGGLFKVVLPENVEGMRQTLQEGLCRVGFIGLKDAPKGIQFGFALPDGAPIDDEVAKRFLANAQQWVVTNSKELCSQRGLPAPVVHDFKPSQQLIKARRSKASWPTLALFGIVGVLLAYRVWWAAGAVVVFALVVGRLGRK